MSSDDESSWRLLFNIALSHGESLRTGRLSHEGWMVFLSSAQLIGTATGVFPVLLEQLWQRLASKVDAMAEAADDHETRGAALSTQTFSVGSGSSSSSSTPKSLPSPERVKAEPPDSSPLPSDERFQGTYVGFSAFVDMMKVICVRVFQTKRYMRLREGQRERNEVQGDFALTALIQSAEDRVMLKESVEYTAVAFLRSFISRSTICASSQMRLRPAQNGWALHVNRLVTHIVGVLLRPVILPLFRRYSKQGRLSEVGYRAFLRDIFPGLDAIEETCAGAIFHHAGFPDIRPLVKEIPQLAASVSPDTAALVSQPTLGLTDFIEAMLMIAVVVYADEVRYPAQRPITAKIWSLFECHVCERALFGTAMCPDPYDTGRYATVSPGLVAVYPALLPRGQCSSFLVEVINVQVGGVGNNAVLPTTAQTNDGEVHASPFLTEVTEISKEKLPSGSPEGRCTNYDVAVEAAAMFFVREWGLLERNSSVPLFDSSQVAMNYAILVGGVVANAVRTSCPDILLVTFPDSLLRPTLYRCAVEAVSSSAASGPGTEEVLHIHFRPFSSLPVELTVDVDDDDDDVSGDSGGKAVLLSRAWGCEDVVVTERSLVQVISHKLFVPLHSLFLSQIPAPSEENLIAPVPPRISLLAVCELCRLLQWCVASAKQVQDIMSLCAQAWAKYRDFQRVLDSAGGRYTNVPINENATTAYSVDTAELSFVEFIGCLATMLFLKRGGRLNDVPDVPRALELALSFIPPTYTTGNNPLSSGDGGPQEHDLHSIPHNSLRDVPFFMALDRNRIRSEKTQEDRDALIASLREYCSLQTRTPATLPPLPENRPTAMRLVCQYGTVNPSEDFHTVIREAAEVVKAHFLQQEMAIPKLGE